jgi:hypothetical protein
MIIFIKNMIKSNWQKANADFYQQKLNVLDLDLGIEEELTPEEFLKKYGYEVKLR